VIPRNAMPRETAYRGYRIEPTSYEILEPSGWVAAAVVWWDRGPTPAHKVVLDRDELRRYPTRDTADARALELAKALIDGEVATG
jgi:hypothetical protein